MKKLVYTLFFVLISVVANGQAKYVFYFIGDGMGVNQVNGTEMYQAGNSKWSYWSRAFVIYSISGLLP